MSSFGPRRSSPADLGHLGRVSKSQPRRGGCDRVAGQGAHAVRRADMPDTTVAMATSVQGATKRNTPRGYPGSGNSAKINGATMPPMGKPGGTKPDTLP